MVGLGSLAQKFGATICRRTIVDRAVRPTRVVVVSERARDAQRFEDAGEDFPIQAFVPEFAVERFAHPILSGKRQPVESEYPV